MEQYAEKVSLAETNTRNLIAAILQILEPERIICFGRRISELQAWSPFVPKTKKAYAVTYDLLIITRASENRSAHELLDMLDNALRDDKVRAVVLIHSVQSVNQALSDGSRFFSTVCGRGSILYDNNGTVMVHGRYPDATCGGEAWRQGFGLARQFLNGAVHFSSSGCSNIALFMLHQAIEQTCNALIRAMTGYRPATHNLSRLLAMTENFCTLSGDVFPRNTSEEKELFTIVARAYSDVRYKPGFQASAQDVVTLIERVATLQRGAEKLYENKID